MDIPLILRVAERTLIQVGNEGQIFKRSLTYSAAVKSLDL